MTTAPEKPKYRYVTDERNEQGRLLAKGELKIGIKLMNVQHKTFVMQEGLASDLFAAESMPGVGGSMSFDAAVWCNTLVSIGTYEGPITLSMLGQLRQVDYAILRDAQLELDKAGESQ